MKVERRVEKALGAGEQDVLLSNSDLTLLRSETNVLSTLYDGLASSNAGLGRCGLVSQAL